MSRRPLAVAALLAAALGCALHATGALSRAELETLHTRFEVRGERPLDRISVVGIDARTFAELPASQSRFPFSRCVFARVLERVARARPRLIVYDVQFTEPSDRPDCDDRLIRAAAAAGNVIFATTEVAPDGSTAVLGGPEGLAAASAEAGNGLLPEQEGALLRVPAQIDGLPTLAAVAARRLGAGVPREAWIDYAGPPDHVPFVSFGRVGAAPDTAFRDRVVVIGATAPVLQDRHPTGYSDAEMSGPEIQANAIDTLLRGAPLSALGGAWALLLVAVVSALAPLATLGQAGVRSLVLAIGGIAVFAAAAQGAFELGIIVPVAAPLVGWSAGLTAALGVAWTAERADRARTRETFARFVGEDVVTRVLARTSDGRLAGERLEATVLFADLRGFTAWAEERDPSEVAGFLDFYLSAVSEIVLDSAGTLVSFLGDGLMAVWGAPLEQPDHADRALAAACDMLAAGEAYPGFEIGIALASGPVMSATVGSGRRLEYAAVGDTTNTAARLQALAAAEGRRLVLADSTRAALGTPPQALVDLGEREIRGRRTKVRVWALA